MTPSLLLALLSWSTASFAETPGPAPAAAVAPTESLNTIVEVAGLVARVHRESGAAVLIGAAGPDAERAALKVSEALPPGEVRVMRIGTIGDDATEMRGALDKAGLRCGIRLGVTTAMTYTATPFGVCSSLPVTAAAPAGSPAVAGAAAAPAPTAGTSVSIGAPVLAPSTGTVSSIPGAGAAINAGAPTAAAPPVPYLVAPPPAPDLAILQTTYDVVALRRVRNPRPREDMPDATWAIRDGRGKSLGAIDFARRVGDLDTERRIAREAATAKTLSFGLAVGGGALAVAGLGLLLARDAGAPDRSDFDVDISSYDTNEEYFAAVAQAEADFRAAEDAHEIKADDRAWIAGFLAGSGVIAIGVSPLASRGAIDRQGVPALYWTRQQADALIVAHNKSVREKIGLPEPEAPKAAVIEVTPPPAEDDDADHEDPPEDDTSGDPEGDRREAPPSKNAPEDLDTPAAPAPRGPPGLHITPVLSPTWTGLVGTF